MKNTEANNNQNNSSDTLNHYSQYVESWDFIDLLQRELSLRHKKNRQYSLRAFAKSLDLESSYLSKLLKRGRPLNQNLIQKLGERLGLAPNVIECYRFEDLKRKAAPKDKNENSSFYFIPQDFFEIIEDPNHYLILEMMKLDGFYPSEVWIAKQLKITINETRACLSRLQKVGLLATTHDGQWQDLSSGASSHVIGANVSSAAHRRSQKRILEASINALETVPIEKRDQSSMMMAGSSQQMELIKKTIKKFRRELAKIVNLEPVKDTVFQLSISFFPILEGPNRDSKTKPLKNQINLKT
jgi:uncharacterized protein (TIGR02147 family)